MKERFFFITISIFVIVNFQSLNVFSQENYQPGIIITLKGDTVKGYIDYRNWGKNPNAISFRNSENGSSTIYNPITISGFRVLKDYYISAIVQAECSPYQLNDLNFDALIKTRTDTIFLRVMFQGAKNLYYYNDRNGKQQFYLKQSHDFELLVYKKYMKVNDDRRNYASDQPIREIKENKTFIGQLAIYLQNCPTLQSELNKTEYTQNSLFKLFEKFYKCSDEEIKYKFATDKPKLSFGVLAGISNTNLRITSNSGEKDYLSGYDYPTSTKISGGIFLDLGLARNQGKWAFNNELILSSYSTGVKLEEYINENRYSTIETKINISYLKLNTMIRYKYPLKKDWFVFANAGYSFGFALTEYNSISRDETFYTQHTITNEILINNVEKLELGWLAGIGLKYKNYSIDTRYENIVLGLTSGTINSHPIRFSFLFGYRFGN